MSRLLIIAEILAVSIASPVSAADSGFSGGIRLGYSVPWTAKGGNNGGSFSPTSEIILGQIPLWADAGWLVSPNAYLGAYVQYAPLLLHGSRPPVLNTLLNADLRTGIDLILRFLPGEGAVPWVGVGSGYEWLVVYGVGYLGAWEFLNLQAGVDFGAGSTFWIGPFASASIAQSSRGWVQFGVKMTFNP